MKWETENLIETQPLQPSGMLEAPQELSSLLKSSQLRELSEGPRQVLEQLGAAAGGSVGGVPRRWSCVTSQVYSQGASLVFFPRTTCGRAAGWYQGHRSWYHLSLGTHSLYVVLREPLSQLLNLEKVIEAQKWRAESINQSSPKVCILWQMGPWQHGKMGTWILETRVSPCVPRGCPPAPATSPMPPPTGPAGLLLARRWPLHRLLHRHFTPWPKTAQL